MAMCGGKTQILATHLPENVLSKWCFCKIRDKISISLLSKHCVYAVVKSRPKNHVVRFALLFSGNKAGFELFECIFNKAKLIFSPCLSLVCRAIQLGRILKIRKLIDSHPSMEGHWFDSQTSWLHMEALLRKILSTNIVGCYGRNAVLLLMSRSARCMAALSGWMCGS